MSVTARSGTVTLTITGLDRLGAEWAAIADAAAADELGRAATGILDAAEAAWPVRTGASRDALGRGEVVRRGHVAAVEVVDAIGYGTEVPYRPAGDGALAWEVLVTEPLEALEAGPFAAAVVAALRSRGGAR